jgi:hypothetical protein
MSSISGTLHNNIYYGPGQAYPSPLTITNTGEVSVSSSGTIAAVEGFGGGTLANFGTIIASASGVGGVYIDGTGGSVDNGGLIQGTAFGLDLAGAGYVTNTKTILSTGNSSTALEGVGGGTYVNQGIISATASGAGGVRISGYGATLVNSGLIQAYSRAIYIEGTALVTNSSSIVSTGPGAAAAVEDRGGTLVNSGSIINRSSSGDGVRLDGAGTVINTGLIQGYSGLAVDDASIVTNASSGTIRAVGDSFESDAVLFQGLGSGTLTNHGTILSAPSDGGGVNVQALGGGTVANYGLIKAYDSGVNMLRTGVITNSGTILSTGGNGGAAVEMSAAGTLVNSNSIIAYGFGQTGAELGDGGTVINSGTIEGYFEALGMGGTGVAINSGVLLSQSVEFYTASVTMEDGGSFTNTAAGYVNRGVFLADGTSSNEYATVVDAGTIVGGIALNLNSDAPDGFLVPTFYGSGTVFLAGTVSGSPADSFPIQFGGTYGLLVLEHGYHINGVVDGISSTESRVIELSGSAGAAVTVNFNPTSFTNFGTVGFMPDSGNYATLALATTADIPGTITGFTGLHETIDLGFISDTDHNATAVLNPINNQLTVTGDNGTAILQLGTAGSYTSYDYTAVQDTAGTGTDVEIICFCRGTMILTDRGEVAVEALSSDDRVILADGSNAPIVWIGEGRVLATRGSRSAATPVIVRRGALANNVPNRDLRVTKAHSLYIDGVLIPVEFLVNHRSILWDDRAQEVSIYHVELETHGVLVANGAPAESYRDDGNRWLFRNANSGWHLPPKPACAPVLTGGPVVDAIWRRLLDRSGPRTGLPRTADPDLHLVVDGVRLDGVRLDGVLAEGGAWRFRLPGAAETLRIVSRSGIPQELGFARDPRSLGVALRQIVVRQGAQVRLVDADDAMLREGFHPFEADNGFRWTDGDAILPREAFAEFSGPMEVVLMVAGETLYLDEGERLLVA